MKDATERLVVAGRREFWPDQSSHPRPVPPAKTKITTLPPPNSREEKCRSWFGAVHISIMMSSHELNRTAHQICRPNPDTFQVVLALNGQNIVKQDRRAALLRPMDLTLIDNSRPYQLQPVSDEDPGQGLRMVFPRTLLPLPDHKVRRLTATTLPCGSGMGALLAGFLTQLTDDTDRYQVRDATRLGSILIDLLTALLTHHLDGGALVSPEDHQRALLAKIHAYIQQHLANPELSPGTIAAAHNVSTRTLHRLFQTQDVAIAEWIRTSRLDRIRRDLADPMFRDRPIHAIAARWGFANPAHFTRAFRVAHGLSPHSYRKQRLGECDRGASPPADEHEHPR